MDGFWGNPIVGGNCTGKQLKVISIISNLQFMIYLLFASELGLEGKVETERRTEDQHESKKGEEQEMLSDFFNFWRKMLGMNLEMNSFFVVYEKSFNKV